MDYSRRPTWDIITDLLHNEGWSLGWALYGNGQGQTIWQADASRGEVRLVAEGETLSQAIGELFRITRGSKAEGA